MNALHSYYAEYNTVANRKRGFAPPSQKFKDIGLRAVPKRGTAVVRCTPGAPAPAPAPNCQGACGASRLTRRVFGRCGRTCI